MPARGGGLGPCVHACMLGLDAQGAMEIVFLASALALLDDYTPDYFSVSHFISFYDNIQA